MIKKLPLFIDTVFLNELFSFFLHGVEETFDTFSTALVVQQLIWVDSLGANEATISFCNSH